MSSEKQVVSDDQVLITPAIRGEIDSLDRDLRPTPVSSFTEVVDAIADGVRVVSVNDYVFLRILVDNRAYGPFNFAVLRGVPSGDYDATFDSYTYDLPRFTYDELIVYKSERDKRAKQGRIVDARMAATQANRAAVTQVRDAVMSRAPALPGESFFEETDDENG